MITDIKFHFRAMVILLTSGLIMAFLMGFGILPEDPFSQLAMVAITCGTGAMIACLLILLLGQKREQSSEPRNGPTDSNKP